MSIPSQPRHERARALLEQPDARGALQDAVAALPNDAGAWLAQICLLEGLPFNTIVPDATMLPQESIRFFYVDQNWLDALVDGALSVAGIGTDEHALLDLLRPHAQRMSRAHALRRRDLKRGLVAQDDDPPPAPAPAPAQLWSGFLMRSVVVSDWPGLTVKAYPDPAGTQTALTPLRFEHISAGVLIGLFDGVLQRVEITQPAQMLHFGVERVEHVEGAYQVPLRGLGGKCELGVQIEGATAPVTLRQDSTGREVIDVTKTVASVQGALEGPYDNAAPVLDSGTLAIELVETAERQVFVPVHVVSFTATPASLPAGGGSTTLAWQVINADSCGIDQGIGTVSSTGSKIVNVGSEDTIFVLSATGQGANVGQEVTVTVAGSDAA